MKKTLLTTTLLSALFLLSTTTQAAEYVIDSKGAHASVNFKIQHLGYSWLTGRFDKLEGTFNYDANNIEKSSIEMKVDVSSINSNHAERDKHLRSDDFLHTDKFPEATFKSTNVTKIEDGKFAVNGLFTLHGISKDVNLIVEKIGEGKDPWGGERAGFSGKLKILLSDFGIDSSKLGDASSFVELDIHLEGIKK